MAFLGHEGWHRWVSLQGDDEQLTVNNGNSIQREWISVFIIIYCKSDNFDILLIWYHFNKQK